MPLLAEEGRDLRCLRCCLIRLWGHVPRRGVVLGGRILLLVGFGISIGCLRAGACGELEQFGKALVVLLEKLEGAESLYAGGGLGSVGELAGSEGMLADGDGGVGGFSCLGGGEGVIVGLVRG